MRFIYIHGFNSGPETRSARELAEILGCPVIPAAMDYARPYGTCVSKLCRLIEDLCPDKLFTMKREADPVCLMGSSLGGFYALQPRCRGIKMVIAWNPVVFPAIQLKQFLGVNCRFTDGVEWTFNEEVLLSYAGAPDPRPWQNETWLRKYGDAGPEAPLRKVFVGTKDELLDSALAQSYWSRADLGLEMRTMVCGHNVPDYRETVALALRQEAVYI